MCYQTGVMVPESKDYLCNSWYISRRVCVSCSSLMEVGCCAFTYVRLQILKLVVCRACVDLLMIFVFKIYLFGWCRLTVTRSKEFSVLSERPA